MSDGGDDDRKALLPIRLAREQQALGMILSLISRSLAVLVIGAAAYLAYFSWS